MNWKRMTDHAITKEIGTRIKGHRLQKNISQQSLAKKAGLSDYTLQKIEYGENTSLKSLIAVLRVLNLLDQIEQFIPRPNVSPIDLLKLEGKKRERASKNNS